MKKSKCGIAILLIMMMAALSLSVWAAPAGKIDTQREVELTVAVLDGETPLVSVPVDIYLVATVDENITLTATDTFAKYNVNIQAKSDAEWKTLASTLEGYVLRDKISLSVRRNCPRGYIWCFARIIHRTKRTMKQLPPWYCFRDRMRRAANGSMK